MVKASTIKNVPCCSLSKTWGEGDQGRVQSKTEAANRQVA